MLQILVFSLDEQRYAVRSSVVERVVQAVEITPLPQAPEVVLGVVNVQGRIVPVYNFRKRLGLTERELQLSDQMIMARTSKRTVALLVDAVADLVFCADGDIVSSATVLPGSEQTGGILKHREGLIFIHDLDVFLSLSEEQCLKEAMHNENALE